VPIRAELAAASARLGPERAAETLLGAQKRPGTAIKRNARETVVSPLIPATDVAQPLMPWDGVGGGLQWPSVVVSEQGSVDVQSERRPQGLFYFPNRFCRHQNIRVFLFPEAPGT
jgi:hypothetical protein